MTLWSVTDFTLSEKIRAVAYTQFGEKDLVATFVWLNLSVIRRFQPFVWSDAFRKSTTIVVP